MARPARHRGRIPRRGAARREDGSQWYDRSRFVSFRREVARLAALDAPGRRAEVERQRAIAEARLRRRCGEAGADFAVCRDADPDGPAPTPALAAEYGRGGGASGGRRGRSERRRPPSGPWTPSVRRRSPPPAVRRFGRGKPPWRASLGPCAGRWPPASAVRPADGVVVNPGRPFSMPFTIDVGLKRGRARMRERNASARIVRGTREVNRYARDGRAFGGRWLEFAALNEDPGGGRTWSSIRRSTGRGAP